MVISKKYVFLMVNFVMMAGIMLSVTDFPFADFGIGCMHLFERMPFICHPFCLFSVSGIVAAIAER